MRFFKTSFSRRPCIVRLAAWKASFEALSSNLVLKVNGWMMDDQCGLDPAGPCARRGMMNRLASKEAMGGGVVA